jgi:hypothetical protein
MTPTPFTEHWSTLSERLGSANDQLISELESCVSAVRLCLEAQIKELRAFISNAQSLIEIENFEQVRESAASKILTEPFQQLERRKPFNRALAAFDSYDRRLDDLVRSLPETCPLNGPGTLAALGQFASTKQRSLARFRRRDCPLGLESILAD